MLQMFADRFIKEGSEVGEEPVEGLVIGSKAFECEILLHATIVSFDDVPKTVGSCVFLVQHQRKLRIHSNGFFMIVLIKICIISKGALEIFRGCYSDTSELRGELDEADRKANAKHGCKREKF